MKIYEMNKEKKKIVYRIEPEINWNEIDLFWADVPATVASIQSFDTYIKWMAKGKNKNIFLACGTHFKTTCCFNKES